MDGNGLHMLPRGWLWTQLEDCVDILDSQRVPVNSDERDKRIGDIPYYGATGQTGWIDGYLFDEELVLLGEDGAPFLDPYKNKAYIIRGKSWVNNHAHVLRTIRELTTNSLICHYLNSVNYRDYVSGTTRFKLNQAPMRKIPVPLPPLPEQHRIVAKIEELFTRLDAGVELLKKIQLQLKRYRQSVLKAAFSGELTAEWRKSYKGELEPASVLLERIKEERKKSGKYKELPPLDTSDLPELPDGWVWTRVGEISERIHYGYTASAESEGDCKMLRITDIQHNSVNWDTVPYCKIETEDKSAYLLKDGDLLFARTGATVGKSFLIRGEVPKAIFASYLIRVIFPKDIIKGYVSNFFQSYAYWLQIREGQIGIGQPNVNSRKLSLITLPLAPLKEQQKILDEIERHLSIADEIERSVEQSLKESARLRQSILKTAFEGKLVPQNPEDEPAEKLLDRIKAKRAMNKQGGLL